MAIRVNHHQDYYTRQPFDVYEERPAFRVILHAARRCIRKTQDGYRREVGPGPAGYELFADLHGMGIHPTRRVEFARNLERIARDYLTYPHQYGEYCECYSCTTGYQPC